MTMPSARCFLATAVVNQNSARDYRRRSYAVVVLDDRLYIICRQHFEGGTLRGPRQGVGVLPQVEGAVRSPALAGSRRSPAYSEDMRFGEGAVAGASRGVRWYRS